MSARSLVLAFAAVASAGAVLAPAAQAAAAKSYTAYVGNDQCPTNNSVSQVFSGSAGVSLGGTVGVGSCPAGIAFAPDGSQAWILNAGENTITPLGGASLSAGVPFPSVVSAPIYATVTPDGKKLLTPGAGSNNLAIISTANTAQVQVVTVGNGPLGVAVLPNGKTAYVANHGDGTVSVVKLGATPSVVKTITFPSPGCTPAGLAVTPDGKAVIAACDNGPLWGIVVATNKALAKPVALPESSGTQQVVVTPNGKKAYASNANGHVYVVGIPSGAITASIPVPGAWGLSISPDGAEVMVGNGNCCFIDTPVTTISTKTDTVTGTLETGGLYTHRWLAYKPTN